MRPTLSSLPCKHFFVQNKNCVYLFLSQTNKAKRYDPLHEYFSQNWHNGPIWSSSRNVRLYRATILSPYHAGGMGRGGKC